MPKVDKLSALFDEFADEDDPESMGMDGTWISRPPATFDLQI